MAADRVVLDVSSETLAQIDALADQRGCSRRDVVLSAVEREIGRNPCGETPDAIRERLRGPLTAQDAFLRDHSIADEWRSF